MPSRLPLNPDPGGPRPGQRRRRLRALTAVLAWATAGTAVLAGPAHATPTPVASAPCAGTLWGDCDLQSAAGGYRYQYSYQAGMVAPVPVPPTPPAQQCDVNCPADPAAVCDLLTAVGPDPMMSPAERAEYDRTVSGCVNYLLVDDPIPLAQVQTALAGTMREKLLPRPSIAASTRNPDLSGPAVILHPTNPASFTGDVTQPLAATIQASPQYHWDFGDGTTDDRTSNLARATGREHGPDATHRYNRPGFFRVTLTAIWHGTFTLPGVAQPLPLQPVRLTATSDLFVGSTDTLGAHPG